MDRVTLFDGTKVCKTQEGCTGSIYAYCSTEPTVSETGEFSVYCWAQCRSYCDTAPLPEPGLAAMFCGLLLLAGLRRRRT